MPKLTKAIVERAEPRERQFTIWCSELRGFGVCVNPGGSKTYLADYRNDAGVRRRMTIGRHGVLTTEEARKRARVILGEASGGDDPHHERRTRRKSLSVSELCDRYIEAADKGLILGKRGLPKKASTIATDKGRIEQHIKPLIGNQLVIDLKQSDIARFVRDVTAGKSARSGKSGKLRGRVRVTGGAGTAARTAGLLGGILSFAASEGVIDHNPAFGVKKPAGQKRDRRLTVDEYRRLGKALDQAKAARKAWQGIALLRFIALTGCRLGEAENLKWSELDLDNQILKLSDSKTGKSIRPLGTAALEVLQSLKRSDEAEHVFWSERAPALRYVGVKRFYRDLFAAAELDGVTPHVLRHSFASVGADLGFTDSTIGSCLGHAGSGITSRYTHRLDSVLIAAANKIAGEVDRQLTGSQGEVVELPRRA